MAPSPRKKPATREGKLATDDTVGGALRLIIEGEVDPGGRITERWIVDTFTVTHAQAREALHRLDKLGALSLSPRRGAALLGQKDADPTDVRPVWLALMKLACEWAEKGGGRDPVSVSDRVVGDSRWAVYAGVRQAISTIGEAARLPRLEDALQRLALQSFIAQRGSPAISLAALEILSAKVAAHDFGGIEAAIEASFVETTRRFPARREAAQLPVVAPTPVVEAGRHAEALRAFIDRIAARIISGGSEAPSAADQLAATILQRIQFGGLRPGEAIRELPIAKEFNTSRGPVRDALRTLDRRGIISIEGRKGAFVRELGESDIVGLFAIRAALSGVQMAEAAAAPERPEWIDDELRAGARLLHLLAHDPESPFENYIVARRALALVTLAAGGNIVVGRLAAELEGEVSILWATVVSKQRQVESANTWEKIVAAIIAGDRRTAELEGRRIVTEAATEALRCSV